MRRKIYLAGPEVFDKEAIKIGEDSVELCSKYGFEGMYPLDNVVNFNQPKEKISLDIFEANEQMIRDCDIVIANLSQWRGKEPDSGTVWECGFAYGLGKTVYCYLDSDKEYIDTFSDSEKIEENGFHYDLNGKMIEDFGGHLNLMLERSVEKIFIGDLESVLKEIS